MPINRRAFVLSTAAGIAAAPSGEIGRRLPAEWKTFTDPETGRKVRQLTTAAANSYPLYYFSPSITTDGRYLVFHSERSGWVQLYRLDLGSGEMAQLTEGRTRDSGWGIWCEKHLRGIYNHLSALNAARREVYYFQDEQVRRTRLDDLASSVLYEMPGRISMGQSMCSPDGRWFAFIHADRAHFAQAYADREALTNMGLFQWMGHEQWRRTVPTTIGLIDTETGSYRDVMRLDFHVHHVLFVDNDRLLINHVRNDPGMWVVRRDGRGARDLRPRDAHGVVVHQVITKRGIFYESVNSEKGTRGNWLGCYDLDRDRYEEVLLPAVDGYLHTGWDPDGRFLFFENHGKTHELLSLHYPFQKERTRVRKLRSMALYPGRGGQRYHAHPFLTPDRRSIAYTEVIGGFAQVCLLDVADLVDRDEYWDRR